jgi:hypothetical protein
MPDCFFPPNGTFVFSILYWFTHTCGDKTGPLELIRPTRADHHSRYQLPMQMKHACIDWRHLAIGGRSKRIGGWENGLAYLNEVRLQDRKLCRWLIPRLHLSLEFTHRKNRAKNLSDVDH